MYNNKNDKNEFSHQPEPPSYSNSVNQPKENGNSQQKPREDVFREIVDKHEISLDFAQRLQQLNGYKIVFIFDDSGSMNAPLMDSPLNNENTLLKATRWDELQYFAKIAIEICTLFNPEGCSIYFLNKQPSPIHNIKHESELTRLFADRPRGFTPLPRVLNQVLSDNSRELNEKKITCINSY